MTRRIFNPFRFLKLRKVQRMRREKAAVRARICFEERENRLWNDYVNAFEAILAKANRAKEDELIALEIK